MPVLRASISERDGTSLSAGTAKRWCDIDAHYLRLPSHSSDYPPFSIVSGLCTGRFANSLAASAERLHGLRTVDLHVTVFKSWCGRGTLKRSHWRIWLHAIVGKQVRLLVADLSVQHLNPLLRAQRCAASFRGCRESVRIGMAFGSAVGEQEHTARDRQTLRRGSLGYCGNGRGPVPASSTRCGCAIPRQVLELHHDVDILPDGYDQRHEPDL
jgi:hypothetical protein